MTPQDQIEKAVGELAKALCEAGYMSVKDYIKLCEKHGWNRK